MAKTSKDIIVVTIIVVGLLFLFSVRSVLAPFVLAAIFAYLLNPVVTLLENKLRFSRSLAVLTIYTLVVAGLVIVTANLGLLLTKESRELGVELGYLSKVVDQELDNLPYGNFPMIKDLIVNTNMGNLFSPAKIWPYFSGAISGLISFFVFLVAGFYFLSEGTSWLGKLGELLPHNNKIELAILYKKITQVLSDYLRGQIFLIILMATVSWLALSVLQVKYALTIGIFTGFAEIIPLIGPLTAGTVAVLVAVFDGAQAFGLPPIFQGLTVASLYFVFRQIEDLFVIPHVLGNATKLHPLVVLFAVLAGGHLWGILGTILAVPLAALARVFYDFYLAKIA